MNQIIQHYLRQMAQQAGGEASQAAQALFPPPPPFYTLYSSRSDGSDERPLPPLPPAPPTGGEYTSYAVLHSVSPAAAVLLSAAAYGKDICMVFMYMTRHPSPMPLQVESGLPQLQGRQIYSTAPDGSTGALML